MASSPIHKLTEEQYLAIEETAEVKSEFYDGEMFAMSGGTAPHARLQADMLFELMSRLRGGPYEVLSADMGIRVNKTRLHTYADGLVACDAPRFANKKRTLLNPKVLIEVLSPSTEKYDRGRKFQHYRQIESLSDYILVSQEEMRIEHYTRLDDNTWQLRDHSHSGAELKIDSIGVSIPLAAIYRRVEFSEPTVLRDVQPQPE